MKNFLKNYPVTLKIDCRNLSEIEIKNLSEKLFQFADLKILGEDLIYLNDEVTRFAYDKIWTILDGYNVIID